MAIRETPDPSVAGIVMPRRSQPIPADNADATLAWAKSQKSAGRSMLDVDDTIRMLEVGSLVSDADTTAAIDYASMHKLRERLGKLF